MEQISENIYSISYYNMFTQLNDEHALCCLKEVNWR